MFNFDQDKLYKLVEPFPDVDPSYCFFKPSQTGYGSFCYGLVMNAKGETPSELEEAVLIRTEYLEEVDRHLIEMLDWLDGELDRLWHIGEHTEVKDTVEYFCNSASACSEFKTIEEVYAFLCGICMTAPGLFLYFSESVIEEISGLADRFKQQAELRLH